MWQPVVGAAIGTVTTLAGPAPGMPGVDPAVGLAGSAVGTFLTTLVVGAIMIAIVPEYTESKMETVRNEPVGSFVYGVVSLLFVVLVAFVFAITIIGILVAIPFVFLAILVWAVGSAVAFLSIAERLVGHEDGWLLALGLAAGMAGVLTLTGVGGIVSFCVGAAGFGAVLRDYLG
ncbi:MAG: hypothetical protein ABEI77_10775 [Halorientalis sp.]